MNKYTKTLVGVAVILTGLFFAATLHEGTSSHLARIVDSSPIKKVTSWLSSSADGVAGVQKKDAERVFLSPDEIALQMHDLQATVDQQLSLMEKANKDIAGIKQSLNSDQRMLEKLSTRVVDVKDALNIKTDIQGHIRESIAKSQQAQKLESINTTSTELTTSHSGTGEIPAEVLETLEQSAGISPDEINELLNR